MKIVKMMVDQMTDPVGFALEDPRFTWIAEGEGDRQTAYHLQMRREYGSELVFDSGVVESEESNNVRFGLHLEPATRYFWRVRVWDDLGGDSDWSREAMLETGHGDLNWEARWIGPDGEYNAHPLLRTELDLPRTVKRARIYACGLGLYELYINGRRVGDELFAPGYNAYDLWRQVQTYDVTDYFWEGRNALGAMLGNGWYRGRFSLESQPDDGGIYGDQLALLCELRVEYLDGEVQVFGSDESWKWTEGPVLDSSIYDGERYDARQLDPDWSTPDYDDLAWRPAAFLDLSYRLLEDRRSVPVRVTQELPVQRVITTRLGETVLDFGQNLTGWVKVRLRGAQPGDRFVMTYGEILDQNGNFYHDNMRTALTRVEYYARGGEEETYCPRFTFFGFRYVRLVGWDRVAPEDFTAQVVHSDLERVGSFQCSDPKVNKLYENTVWGQRGNFLDVPTDCPQRDERLGWTGDAQIFAPTACLHYGCDAFYHKFLYDLKLEQEKNGFVPMYVPFCRNIDRDPDPCAAWGDAATVIPWTVYLHYGDKSILEDQFDSMRAWVDYVTAQDRDGTHLYAGGQLGDWLAQDTGNPDNLYGATPTDLVATAYYAYSAGLTAKAARALGRGEEAQKYETLYGEIREALYREFLTPTGRVSGETQTAYALLLRLKLLKPEHVARAADQLTRKLEENGYKLSTGFVGMPCLCPALTDYGYNAYAYHLLLEEGFPSWLYEVNLGATTVWERWNSLRPDGTPGDVTMNSFNHYAYGAIAQWLYERAAGIEPDERRPGFKRIRLRPRPHRSLQFAKAALRTPYGEVRCGWTLAEDELTIQCAVPFNTTATLLLPDSEGAKITGGAGAQKQDRRGDVSYLLKPGEYLFRYKPNGKTIYSHVEKKLIRPI